MTADVPVVLIWLAYFFILAPIDPPKCFYSVPGFQEAIEYVATQEDWWSKDTKESFMVYADLGEEADVHVDFLHYIRSCREATNDCPHTYWRMAFPNRESLSEAMTASKFFTSYCDAQAAIYVSQPAVVAYWEEMSAESEETWRTLNACDNIQLDWLPIWATRQNLKALKDRIGEQDFYSGRLPCSIPYTWLPKHE